jgi:ACR3 family arsenite transporter
MSIGVRQYAYRHGGQDQLNRMIELFKPVTTVGLLATLVLIFIYQGHTIGSKPLHIVLIAIPLTIQTLLIFSLTYWMGYMVCLDPEILGPASMISTSNFFELAVAIAVAVYGADSGASLATVVGVLVEVPTMLFLVWLCKKMAPSVLQRNAECDVKCKGLRDFAQCRSCKPASPKEAYVEVAVLDDACKRVGAEEA